MNTKRFLRGQKLSRLISTGGTTSSQGSSSLNTKAAMPSGGCEESTERAKLCCGRSALSPEVHAMRLKARCGSNTQAPGGSCGTLSNPKRELQSESRGVVAKPPSRDFDFSGNSDGKSFFARRQ